jgi:hypothetical protein
MLLAAEDADPTELATTRLDPKGPHSAIAAGAAQG